MQITFVYDLEDEYWNDGLKKAIDILSEKHQVRKQNGFYKPVFTNFVLVWGAFGSKQQKSVMEAPFRKGICVAGGPINHPDIHAFDVIFVETKWHQREFRKLGVNAVLAFGTNNDIFYDMQIPRTIDRLYPAAFAKWKRHELFLELPGKKFAVGYMQPNEIEKECYEMCINDPETTVIPRVTPEVLAWFYNQSKKVSVTANIYGGGERTVLEGLACGCDVEVPEDNIKLLELLNDCKARVPTAVDYAQSLKRGIEECAS